MADQQQKDLAELKHKRGWWFAVVFLMLVLGLVLFLAYVKIVDENRDVLVGILGVITGSISSMVAIASGRDPAEIEELKEKLGKANADREALIARLRDAQIQLQLHRDQLHDLQSAMLEKLSIFNGSLQKRDTKDVELSEDVKTWLPATVQKDSEDSEST
jgi:hypothetical protein